MQKPNQHRPRVDGSIRSDDHPSPLRPFSDPPPSSSSAYPSKPLSTHDGCCLPTTSRSRIRLTSPSLIAAVFFGALAITLSCSFSVVPQWFSSLDSVFFWIQNQQPLVAASPPWHLTNFQNHYACDAKSVKIVRPRSVADIQNAVRKFRRIQGAGTGYSWNEPFFCAKSESVKGADSASFHSTIESEFFGSEAAATSKPALGSGSANILTTTIRPLKIVVDEERRTVTVDAGVRVLDLITYLGDYVTDTSPTGWALPAIPWFVFQTIAGAVSTGTHGSSLKHGSLSSQTVSLTFVLANGSLATFSDPEFDRPSANAVNAVDTPSYLLKAARISTGRLGVLTQVTLRIVPDVPVRRTLTRISASQFLDEIEKAQASFEASGGVLPAHMNETEWFWITQRHEFLRVTFERADDLNLDPKTRDEIWKEGSRNMAATSVDVAGSGGAVGGEALVRKREKEKEKEREEVVQKLDQGLGVGIGKDVGEGDVTKNTAMKPIMEKQATAPVIVPNGAPSKTQSNPSTSTFISTSTPTSTSTVFKGSAAAAVSTGVLKDHLTSGPMSLRQEGLSRFPRPLKRRAIEALERLDREKINRPWAELYPLRVEDDGTVGSDANTTVTTAWTLPPPFGRKGYYSSPLFAASLLDVSRVGVATIAMNATVESSAAYLHQPEEAMANIISVPYDQYEVAVPVSHMGSCWKGLLELLYGANNLDGLDGPESSTPDYGFRTAPLLRFTGAEKGTLLSASQDTPHLWLNIEDYLFYNSGDKPNKRFREVMAFLRSSDKCGSGTGLNGSGGRLHWGKAGWPDPGCWHGDKEYPETWCDFGCAVRELDPYGKFADAADGDRWTWEGVDLKTCCDPKTGFRKELPQCQCKVAHKKSAEDCPPPPYYTTR